VVLDGDLTRLAQIFSNLLTNSVKYTDPGGRIRLDARRCGDAVTVTVRDSGIGIPQDALPLIFDMFSQADRTLEGSRGGLGIGLALVKGLVEMHGGAITAESPGPGQGSTFTVRLPVWSRPAEPAASTSSAGERSSGPRRRILVVDDNHDAADTMATMLELLGDEVCTAHDGLAAVAAAECFRPAAILMDVGMPGMNGYDATRRIREQPWGKHTRIIALTGWGQDHDRARSRDAGCDEHLVKPVSPEDLQKALTGLAPAPS
jgi:CheY-like chemotaxis protein